MNDASQSLAAQALARQKERRRQACERPKSDPLGWLIPVGVIGFLMLPVPGLGRFQDGVFHLCFGWCKFLAFTLRQVEVDRADVVLFLVLVVGFTVSLHAVAERMFRRSIQMGQGGVGQSRVGRWRWKWSMCLTGALLTLFVTCVGSIGLLHHVAWAWQGEK